MKPLSEEVKYHRWKMIGHILRNDRNDDCNVAMSWASVGKRRRGMSPKTTWRRTVEKEKEKAGWSLWEEVRRKSRKAL